MLFILTGGVQTGKTRWLERLVAELACEGVLSFGVIAPGVWRPMPDDEGALEGDGARFEKLGIDAVLLPQGERVPFAVRRDLLRSAQTAERDGAESGDGFGENAAEGVLAKVSVEGVLTKASAEGATSQSDKASLGWAIYDDALAKVNAHFDGLAVGETPPGLLVVDEIGRLELQHGTGLEAAVRALDAGPSPAHPHALIVVRDWLAAEAESRFEPAWEQTSAIAPDEAGRDAVRAAFGLRG